LGEINTGLREPRQLSRDAVVFLTRQEWPGNLREMRAVLERGALVARLSVIETDDLLTDPSPNSALRVAEGELPALYQGFSMEDFLSKIRRGIIFKAIDQSGGNQSEASRLLGVSPQAVNKFLKVEQAAAIKG
jgi:DNA-binding NtrC family response regulator